RITFKDLPQDDPRQRRPDITLAQEVLGWKPIVGREEGLSKTYDYFKALPETEWYQMDHKQFDQFITK
ncbi:MAG: SDR family NAD-dependent epimerase/dehydratase, partial [Flavobacteriales bacterium]